MPSTVELPIQPPGGCVAAPLPGQRTADRSGMLARQLIAALRRVGPALAPTPEEQERAKARIAAALATAPITARER